jgi:hypothetical protein
MVSHMTDISLNWILIWNSFSLGTVDKFFHYLQISNDFVKKFYASLTHKPLCFGDLGFELCLRICVFFYFLCLVREQCCFLLLLFCFNSIKHFSILSLLIPLSTSVNIFKYPALCIGGTCFYFMDLYILYLNELVFNRHLYPVFS